MSSSEFDTKPSRSNRILFATIATVVTIACLSVYTIYSSKYSNAAKISGTENEDAALTVLSKRAATLLAEDIPSFFHAQSSTKILRMVGSMSEWDEYRSPDDRFRVFEVNGEFETPNQAGVPVRVYCKATLEFNLEREWKYRAILIQDCPKNTFSAKGYEFADAGLLFFTYPEDVISPPIPIN